ncbi:putative MATE family efflux protein [Paenibacillus polymyxa]|uniref:MATE family efflux transporter n=1 Tax=Paenibacillus polymyxa TaxID=1406 RepID=UPI0027930329|nr:MATE family efflux transporter [Paenibacillus polymyxa]MDQ0045771.1 putative MATE family efflux protein [Paenibacillus polymyxa]
MELSKKRNSLGLLAYPIYFELLAGVIAGIIDIFWVARLGSASVAAVTVATSLENVLLAIILIASAGTTVLISRYLGNKDLSSIKSAVRDSWILWALISLLVGGLGFVFRAEIASLFTSSREKDTLILTTAFLAISFPGIIIFYAQNIVDSIFKGYSNTKFPMQMALLSNLLILVLDPLFIYGWLGFPQLGVQGAALATVLGRTVTLMIALYTFYRSDIIKALKQVEYGAKTRKNVKDILNIGLPMSGDFIARMGSNMILIGLIGTFGVYSMAAYGIGTKIIVFITMFFYAVRQAASIQISYQLGAGEGKSFHKIGKKVLWLGGAVGLLAGILLLVLAPFLLRIFTNSEQVIQEGMIYLYYMSLYLLPLSFAVSIGGVFLGSGQSRTMFYVTLIGTAVTLLGAFTLSSFNNMLVHGVWISQILGVVVQAVILLFLFQRGNASYKSVALEG